MQNQDNKREKDTVRFHLREELLNSILHTEESLVTFIEKNEVIYLNISIPITKDERLCRKVKFEDDPEDEYDKNNRRDAKLQVPLCDSDIDAVKIKVEKMPDVLGEDDGGMTILSLQANLRTKIPGTGSVRVKEE